MRIVLAQINTTVGDLNGNTDKIIHFMEKARSDGADLVIFPELAITGYPPKDLLLKESFVKENKDVYLKKIIENSKEIALVVGFVDYNTQKKGKDGTIAKYNAAAIINNQNLLGIEHKTYLPTYDVFDETRYFSPAEKSDIFVINNKKIAVQICEDLWDANYGKDLTSNLKALGAELIINISASPFHYGKRKEREKLIKSKARKNKIPIIYTNLVGGQDDLIFDGESMVFDEGGRLSIQAKKFEEDYVIFDTEDNQPKAEVYDEIEEIKEIYNALVLGTEDYIRKSGFKKAVIALSGGIDSAVTTKIAVDALGKENVVGLSLPGEYSSSHSIKDAKDLADNLGIKLIALSITDIFSSYLCKLEPLFENTSPDITEENIQARIRGNIVMAFSNKFGYLPLTTGNKSEIAVGYCTLYGDMSGGYAVLSDVFKTKVYELAGYINKEKEVIPKNTIEKPPSAELRPGQLDQDSLPDYKILDAILKLYIEDHRSKKEIIEEGFKEKIVDYIISLVDRNEYKRMQMPPGPKITPKSFGSGRRMPIINNYKG